MKIAVIIPSFKATKTILDVIRSIPEVVDKIYVVDDCCPERVGDFVESQCDDPRVSVIRRQQNAGVGAAMVTGYRQAMIDGFDIMVKIDSDGQMDPRLVDRFVKPIVDGEADYTKGNRFYYLHNLNQMPKLRLFGNAALSFITKLSSGYWKMFDPTNGYTAVSRCALEEVELSKLSNRYFFESDFLFRLYLARAVVVDIPMEAKYGEEESHLKPLRVLPEFVYRNCVNFVKRIGYSYFLRDFNIASMELVAGLLLLALGGGFGIYKWISNLGGVPTTSGEVMLAALPVIIGMQLLLAFFNFDSQNAPTKALSESC